MVDMPVLGTLKHHGGMMPCSHAYWIVLQVAIFVGLTYLAGLMWLANGFWLAAVLPVFSLPFSGLLLLQALRPSLQRTGPSLLRLSSATALSFGLTLGLGLAGHSRQQQLALLLR